MSTRQVVLVGHKWMKQHLRYFSHSLKVFPEKFAHLVFEGQPVNDDYLVYLCPICLIQWLAVDKRGLYVSSEFSEDHFPPASVGGKHTVLVCKTCNNTAGNKYENSLLERLKKVSFDKKISGSIIKTTVVIEEVKGWRHGIVGIADDQKAYFQLTITENEKLAPLTPTQQATNNNGKGWKATVTPRSNSEACIKKALIKTAYLYCFYNWGYDFAFTEQAAMMRKAFYEDLPYPVEVGVLWFDYQKSTDPNFRIPEGLCVIDNPAEALSLIVNVPMILKDNGYKCVVPVLIPSPTPNALKELKAVEALLPMGRVINISPINNAVLESVTDGYHQTWTQLKGSRVTN